MNKSQLKTGRNVIIRDISIDDIDEIEDITQVVMENGVPVSIKGLARQRTAWLRSGLAGGDFEDWGKKPNGSIPPDEVLKQLSHSEKEECIVLIKESQHINPTKPFKSN